MRAFFFLVCWRIVSKFLHLWLRWKSGNTCGGMESLLLFFAQTKGWTPVSAVHIKTIRNMSTQCPGRAY